MRRLAVLWRGDPLRWTLATIAAGTAVSGFVQMVAPGFVLHILSASSTGTSRLFFAIVGMFMAIIGGMLTHALLAPTDRRIVVLWGALQKLAASGAVTLGVVNGIFSAYALLIASFDFLTGSLGAWYWWRLRR